MRKKTLGIIGLGCSALFLTACGGSDESHTLTCTKDMSDALGSLGTWNTEMKIDYNSNETKVEGFKMTMEMNLTSDEVTEEMMTVFEENLKDVCNSGEYESCNTKRDNKKVTLEASGSAEKMGDNVDVNESLEETKKSLEEEGFTCKK